MSCKDQRAQVAGYSALGRIATRLFGVGVIVALCSPVMANDRPELPFNLVKPYGIGPHPAVVILHDCSGLGPGSSNAPGRWASQLFQRGYVALAPNSFAARGRTRGVCTDATPPLVSPDMRVDDAYAALDHLRSLPYVDARRIAVMGGSHGGTTTLATIVDTPSNAQRATPGFAAAIALYPNCGRGFGDWKVRRANNGDRVEFATSGAFKPRAPLLILTGALDDWTPAEPCQKLADAATAAGYPVEIKVYPGAHHSFDSPAGIRHVAERINNNAPTGRGATTGGDAGAWADSIGRVEQFLSTHLPK